MNEYSDISMTENCPIARWRRKKEARPAEILDAALSPVCRKRLSRHQNGRHCPGSRRHQGTPYLYFQNKEEIFKAIARGTIVANLQQLAQVAADYQGSTSELLHHMIEHWWQEVGSAPSAGLCKLMIAEAANFPELAQFYFEEVIIPSNQMLAGYWSAASPAASSAKSRWSIPLMPCWPRLLTTMIFNHSFGQLPGCCIGSTKDPLGFLKDALDLVLHGLKKN
jgi:hypothetical protein